MTSAPSVPTFVVRGPDSFPALVPHLLGFHPESSVVALGLGDDRRTVRVTVRLDLPRPCDPADPTGPRDDVRDVVSAWLQCLQAFVAVHARTIILLVYPRPEDDPWRDDVPGDLPERELVDLVRDEMRELGFDPVDALCVVGDRLRSYWCEVEDCCPPEGRVVDGEEALRVNASFVGAGSAPLASRADLETALVERPLDDPFRARVERTREGVVARLPAGVEVRVTRFVEEVRRWGAEPRSLVTLARLVAVGAWLCSSIRSRDLLLRTLTADPDREVLGATRAVLSEAVRCSSDAATAPVATALAVCAWVSGDGASARVAVERALDADPAYSLASLVSAALDGGVPPWQWTQMMAELSVAEILGELDAPGRLVALDPAGLGDDDLVDLLDWMQECDDDGEAFVWSGRRGTWLDDDEHEDRDGDDADEDDADDDADEDDADVGPSADGDGRLWRPRDAGDPRDGSGGRDASG
jgi:hypothetical protein